MLDLRQLDILRGDIVMKIAGVPFARAMLIGSFEMNFPGRRVRFSAGDADRPGRITHAGMQAIEVFPESGGLLDRGGDFGFRLANRAE